MMDSDQTALVGRSFDNLWDSLLPIGRDPRTGGYRRFAWSAADREAKEWFHQAAAARGMPVEVDRNGNLWAWWGDPRPGSVVTGSHLDSVPDGGPFDGPLGVVSAFCAIDLLSARDTSASGESRGRRSVAVVCFTDEEGARFGVACVGSRLLTGVLDPSQARRLADADGITLADAMRSAGHDPDRLGRDDEALSRIGAFVELHIEQGRALADLDSAVAIGEGIWPHGRWRFDFTGSADHAGTTKLADRHDPTLAYARTILDARRHAERLGALATFGKVVVEPNGTNAIPSSVRAWLDARAREDATVEELVSALVTASGAAVDRESWSPEVEFDPSLRTRLAEVVAAVLQPTPDSPEVAPSPRQSTVPILGTGAGHDAGVLAAKMPTGMLFVRNPTGVSHSPREHADRADCLSGVAALAAVLQDLAGGHGND
jgi:beta-ureidopropionase / N-carbamoyl-L-amino-acid hydrolase